MTPAPFNREALSSVGSLWLDLLSPIFPWESRESYEVFYAVQKAAEVKAELLRAQLVESDGRVIGKALTLCSSAPSASPLPLSFFDSFGSRAGGATLSLGSDLGLCRGLRFLSGGALGQRPVPCTGCCRFQRPSRRCHGVTRWRASVRLQPMRGHRTSLDPPR